MSSNQPIDQAIASLQVEEEEKVALGAAGRYGLQYVKLIGYPILAEVLLLIPEQDAVNFRLCAYLRARNELNIATANPPSEKLNKYLMGLANRLNITIKLKFCSKLSLSYGLTLYIAFREKELEKAKALHQQEGDDYTKIIKSIEDVGDQIQKVSTTKLIDLIFAGAVIVEASDIHLEPLVNNTRMRYRIDGILQDVATLTKQQYESIRSRIKNLAHLKLDVSCVPQDGRFELKIAGRIVDVRTSTLPASFGEDIVMRLLLQDAKFLKIDELGFNPEVLGLIKNAIRQPHGMILNTGPTGSGKTTTLYAILSEMNRPQIKIITIEDPIEYRLSGINQIQVNPAQKLTFASALRAALRQDPDIIMVGEIRDPETAQIALQAALTGHLVLSTLHTNSAPAAIARLLEMGIEPYLLAGSINLIIGQRLVRRLCQVCRGSDTKCQECGGDGFKGRLPLVEALKPTSQFNELIGRKATIDEFERKAKELGMQNMLEDGLAKVAVGLTVQTEVERVTREAS